MTRTSLIQCSLATVASLCVAAFADVATPTTTPDEIQIRLQSPFTGAEEPRPGDLLVGKPMGPARTERAAFLGVGAISIDATLRSQLDLPRGIGLTVGFVEKDSPAANAGVQQHDILQKLNDQLIVNAPQLATLVRTFKAGDEVTLSVIRKGKPLELKATLIERDLPPLADAGNPFTINFATEPTRTDALDALKPDDGKHLQWQRVPFGTVGDPAAPNGPRVLRFSPDMTRMISRDDGTHSIEITQRGDSKSVTIHDASGKLLFDGPYNTDEDAAKMPGELRKKVKQILDGIEIHTEKPTTSPSDPKAAVDRLFDRLSSANAAT